MDKTIKKRENIVLMFDIQVVKLREVPETVKC